MLFVRKVFVYKYLLNLISFNKEKVVSINLKLTRSSSSFRLLVCHENMQGCDDYWVTVF